MKKLSLSLLALLLAATVYAAPDGWSRINGAWQNDGVAAQSDAIERGGSFYLDLENRALTVYPWRDNSTDRISMRPVLPPGVTVGELVETNWGWKAPMSNGWDIWLVDMQATKTEAYVDYLSAGMALVYGKIPVAEAEAHAGGEWRPKKIKFTAPDLDDYALTIQPGLTAQQILDGHSQPLWAEGSIAIYHANKANNRGFRKYMTGKIAHLPRPLAVGWKQGQITGWAFGRYEDLGGGIFEKVFAINGQFNTDMTRKGLGNPTTISVSADLGYSSVGISQFAVTSTARCAMALPIGTMTEDGQVTSHSFYAGTAAAASSYFSATYADDGVFAGSPGAIHTDSQTTQGAFSTSSWNTQNVAAGSYGLLNGDDVWMVALPYGTRAVNLEVLYDFGPNTAWRLDSTSDVTTMPALYTGSDIHSGESNVKASAYITYTPGGAVTTPVTTNTTVTPDPQNKGVNVAISADINTDTETITTAEYFFGADPGEGSGIAMALGAGTTSRTATVSADTSALVSGVHTVSVRGFDAVNGWGAVDSDTFTVELPVVQNVAAVGGDEEVILSWTANAVFTSGYRIVWDTVSPPVANVINTGGPSGYTHTGRTNGVEYFYIVQGKDAGGTGPDSSIVSAVAASAPPATPLSLSIGLQH